MLESKIFKILSFFFLFHLLPLLRTIQMFQSAVHKYFSLLSLTVMFFLNSSPRRCDIQRYSVIFREEEEEEGLL